MQYIPSMKFLHRRKDADTLEELVRVTSIPDESNEKARLRPAYASFGDEGVTATANAHGHLLQITRYFRNELSGFYCVDLPETPPPNLITSRLDVMGRFCQDPNQGMRLGFKEPTIYKDWIMDDNMPAMKFVHDRWPLFVAETPVFDLSIQYIVSEKTVYQKYSFELKQGRQITKFPALIIDANVLIRNLNFVERDDANNRGVTAREYSNETPDNAYIIRKHGPLENGSAGPKTIGLIIMAFINEQHCNVKRSEGHDYYQIIPGDNELLDLQNRRKMDVTITYTLELMESTDSSNMVNNISKAKKDLVTSESKMDNKFEILSYAQESHLNFILRRNLEHILSVCSIPTDESSGTSIVPIALTCGEISNHRIVSGASL